MTPSEVLRKAKELRPSKAYAILAMIAIGFLLDAERDWDRAIALAEAEK